MYQQLSYMKIKYVLFSGKVSGFELVFPFRKLNIEMNVISKLIRPFKPGLGIRTGPKIRFLCEGNQSF